MPGIFPEDAQCSRIEHEALTSDDGEAKPAGRQRAGKVSVGEEGDITIERVKAGDQPIRAR